METGCWNKDHSGRLDESPDPVCSRTGRTHHGRQLGAGNPTNPQRQGHGYQRHRDLAAGRGQCRTAPGSGRRSTSSSPVTIRSAWLTRRDGPAVRRSWRVGSRLLIPCTPPRYAICAQRGQQSGPPTCPVDAKRSKADARLFCGWWMGHSCEQGGVKGQLANRLRRLAEGLSLLGKGLGPELDNTVVVVMSEFGRTVRENGTEFNHGHGNVMWLFGGNVNGRRMYGRWAGLTPNALYEGGTCRSSRISVTCCRWS